MKAVHLLTFTAAILLGACSHYSEDLSALDGTLSQPVNTAVAYKASAPQDIAPAAGGALAPASNFSQYLAREYYDMAKYENEKAYDYKAAKLYTKKAVTASKGEVPVPSKVSAFDVPSEKVPELTEARKRLISALKEQNTPENAQALAIAQGRYECWLERAEEAADDVHYQSCKNEFEGAIASLTMPAAGDSNAASPAYDIAFAQNSAAIAPQDATLVDQIAQFLTDPQSAGYTASLTGFGTGSAQNEYGMQLTTGRVNAVRDALAAKGVSQDRLLTILSPSVDAAQGKVQIVILPPAAQQQQPVSAQPVSYSPAQAQPVQAPATAPVSSPAPAEIYETN